MILRFLGVMDLLSVLTLIWSSYADAPWRLVVVFAAYLMIKGYTWRGSIASFIDIVTGVYLLMTMFFASALVTWLLAIHLGLKAYRSIAA